MLARHLRTLVQASSPSLRSPRLLRSLSSSATYKPDMESIKQLRAASDAPMRDVKSALTETKGDISAAFEWLRKKGVARASSRAGRVALQGLVGLHIADQTKAAAMVEVNCETDFAAVNDLFQRLVEQVALALASSSSPASSPIGTTVLDAEALKTLAVNDSSVAEIVPQLIGKIGENVVARRAVRLQMEQGKIFGYLHNKVAPELGRSGAMVALQFDADKVNAKQMQELETLGTHLAMHVVAAKPRYLSREAVPKEIVDKERELYAALVKDAGKPAHIQAKMIDGRLNKFYSEHTLLDQFHVVEDGNPTVQAHIDQVAKSIGVDIKVAGFERYDVGEADQA